MDEIRGLVRAAPHIAPRGTIVEVFDLGDLAHYNQDVEDAGEPPSVIAFKRAISGANALLVATPEYNRGMPGVLKNAIDWASRPAKGSPFRDKSVAVLGASTGGGATARAQAQLRDAFVFTGACVMPLPELMIAGASNHWWHVPLYVTARGLTTSSISYGRRQLQADFDFRDHRLDVVGDSGSTFAR